ncbi:hypothetical protein C0995_016684 [Termitomyces sp. Mi166|nr:hypothetical protein C0995_016684 [Termitomyces sp. Mi166\
MFHGNGGNHGHRIPLAKILYGQSIGGAVSIDLASRNPTKIHALILENTFTSLPNLIPDVFPALRHFSFLCHQKWDSASKVLLIPPSTPILMLSGAKDNLVPQAHMRALWEVVARHGETKTSEGQEYKVGLEHARFVEFPYGGHSKCFAKLLRWVTTDWWSDDTCVQTGYWPAVVEFVESVCARERESKGKL